MVQGYYTLEEGASRLGITTDRLSQMAQKREVRAFADRGTWRFRVQDIEEMSRRMGHGSSPDLQLGDAQAPPPVAPRPKTVAKLPDAAPTPAKSAAEDELFDFAPTPGDDMDFGFEIPLGDSPSQGPASKKSGLSPSPKPGRDSDVKMDFDLPLETPSKSPGPRKSGLSPTPRGGSDSDVKLVPEGSDVDFHITLDEDSDVKLESLGPTSSKSLSKPKTGLSAGGPSSSSGRKKSSLGPAMDSGVRLVGMEDDELTSRPPRGPEDSAVRLEAPGLGSSSDEMLLTGDMDLDAELRQAEDASRAQKARSKLRPKTRTVGDAPSSPAQQRKSKLSSLGQDRKSKLGGDPQSRKSKLGAQPPSRPAPGSDEFDLIPGDEEQQTQALSGADDDEVSLGDLDPVGLSDIGGTSGINLSQPADSGINLEHAGQGADDKIEFEIGLDDVEATPRPGAALEEDSSSDFELSLDSESTPQPAAAGDDSSSEFELTLDDSAGLELEPAQEEAAASTDDSEHDIFETDFEVPALDDESNSAAVALDEGDTDLESSDFDLSLAEEESGSQVVALDDEELGADAMTVGGGDMEGEEVDELLADDAGVEEAGFDTDFEAAEEEEEEEEDYAAAPAAAPKSWGLLPALLMMPTAVIMFVLALMAFELVHGMWGYRQNYQPTGFVVEGISKMIGVDLPPDKKK